METKVLTQEELQSLRNLRDQQNDILAGLGSLEYKNTEVVTLIWKQVKLL